MKKHTRRILALLSAVALSLSLAACDGEGGEQVSSGAGVDGELFTSDTKLEIVVGSHVSWPYNENWAVWQNFKKTVGGDITITSIPNETLETKINLMLTSPETLPDLIHSNDGKRKIADVNAGTGAFIAIDDCLDQMPNFTKYFDSLDPAKKESLFMQRRSSDGKIYYSVPTTSDGIANLRSWLYRKDIFEKVGITKTPETTDELYEVAKQLKAAYPDSYPLCFRYGVSGMNVFLPSWRPYFRPGVFYDYNTDTWHVGAMEEEMLDAVKFFIKMADEGLVPPNFTTIEHKSWEELITTNRAFIIPDYNVRIDFFTPAARVENPDFTLAVMKPPRATGPNGQNKILTPSLDVSGYLIPNTGDEERIANAVKLLDWFYSDEGSELMNWGVEGETYEVVDGVKKYITPDGADARVTYGFGTQGTYARRDIEAEESSYSQEMRDQFDIAKEYSEEFSTPTSFLAYNDEEKKIINEYATPLNDFIEEEISKFYLKQRPLTEWDSFVNTLKNDMHVDEVLAAYKSAYDRVAGK